MPKKQTKADRHSLHSVRIETVDSIATSVVEFKKDMACFELKQAENTISLALHPKECGLASAQIAVFYWGVV